MDNQKVFAMEFTRVYPLLVAKAQRKGRTAQEVEQVTCWLTGYTPRRPAPCPAGWDQLWGLFPQCPGS